MSAEGAGPEMAGCLRDDHHRAAMVGAELQGAAQVEGERQQLRLERVLDQAPISARGGSRTSA
jgi:hypothetical protein